MAAQGAPAGWLLGAALLLALAGGAWADVCCAGFDAGSAGWCSNWDSSRAACERHSECLWTCSADDNAAMPAAARLGLGAPLLVAGTVFLFWGYRRFSLLLATDGLLVGCLLGAAVGAAITQSRDGTLASAALGGVLLLATALRAWRAGVFTVGFLLGCGAAALVIGNAGDILWDDFAPPLDLLVPCCVCGLVGGCVALHAVRPMAILSSAASGSAAVLVACRLIYGQSVDLTALPMSALVAWAMLLLFGMTVQHRHTARNFDHAAGREADRQRYREYIAINDTEEPPPLLAVGTVVTGIPATEAGEGPAFVHHPVYPLYGAPLLLPADGTPVYGTPVSAPQAGACPACGAPRGTRACVLCGHRGTRGLRTP